MLDLAGHGLSERPDASYRLEWHSLLVGRWLEALGIEDVDLVGHSYGGGIALWMLRTPRPRIRRLALVAAGGLGRDVAFALRVASVPYFVERFGQPFMSRGTRLVLGAAGGVYEADDAAWLSSMNGVAGSARAFSRTVRDVIDWRGQHRHFRDGASDLDLAPLPPIALLWGDRDTVIPITHAYDMAPLLGGASVTRFARCGHFPHRQQPKKFVRALEGFLDAPQTDSLTSTPSETLPQLRAA